MNIRTVAFDVTGRDMRDLQTQATTFLGALFPDGRPKNLRLTYHVEPGAIHAGVPMTWRASVEGSWF